MEDGPNRVLHGILIILYNRGVMLLIIRIEKGGVGRVQDWRKRPGARRIRTDHGARIRRRDDHDSHLWSCSRKHF
jgi:hypothetical protein